MPGDESLDRPRERARLDTLGQLTGTVLAYFVMGAVVLVVIDLVFVLPSGRGFGQTSGWIAALPTVWVYTDQFRRYTGGSRWAVLLLGVVLGLAAGLAAAIVAPAAWAPMYTGGLGGLVAALVYGGLWHAGMKSFGKERPA